MAKIKSARTARKAVSASQRLLDSIQTRFAQQGTPFASLKGQMGGFWSMEGLDESTEQAMNREADELEATLTEVIAEDEANGAQYTEAQKEAAINSAVAAAAPQQFLGNVGTEVEEGALQLGDAAEGDVGRLKEAIEAYDETENKNAMAMSFLYNLRAARQDDFGEGFFPTVVAATNEAAISVTVDLFSVISEITRKLDGTAPKGYELGRKNIIMALRDPSILHNDTTRCYPVVRTGQNEALFVDASDVPVANIETEEGFSIPTAPLKFGKIIEDYIGLCAPDALVEAGAFNHTDALDSNVQLSELVLKVGGEVFTFKNLDMIAGSDFNYAVQGKNRRMDLNTTFRTLAIDEHTKKADGTDSTHLSSVITAKQTVRLTVDISGQIDLETGRLSMNTTEVEVTNIHDADGNRLDMSRGAGQTAKNLFNDAKIIGYRLIARRINSNRRERGQLLQLHQETRRYHLPTLAPISIVRPTSESDQQDTARLDHLVTTTYIRCSNAAVDALLKAEALIRSSAAVQDISELYAQDTLGMARFFVTPWYKHRTLDVQAELQTLKSQDRLTDLTAVLVNAIREQVYSAYWESNYKAACDVIYGPGGKKPMVIIGTDANIINYLMVTGDFRTLGNEFDFKLVSTNNKQMEGKIRWSFGRQEGAANDLSNPLHFGNMVWRPELTAILPTANRQNTFSRELTVQPSFRHITHLPIMGAIDVVNLPKAVVDYKVLSTHSV